MKAEFINPFITATMNVLTTMAQLNPLQGKPHIKEGKMTSGVVTGVIGMGGNQVTGNMMISFDEAAILKIVSNMLMEEFKEVTPEVIDAVGEITNMICGGAKSLLSEQGFRFEMATPVIIRGKDVELTQLSKAPIVVIPFEIETGKFQVEANLAPISGS